MGSLRERIAAYVDVSANLLTQLNELDELRERVRKAQLSRRDAQATETARHHPRRVLVAGADARKISDLF
jgi:hypothetical protein